jgi:hypothetical protein
MDAMRSSLTGVAYSLSPDALTLVGDFNAKLCSNAPSVAEDIPYRITFNSVLYLRIIELDIDPRALAHAFDIVEYSALVESFRASDLDKKVTADHAHYSFCTYDHIFEIVANGYDLTIGEPRPA